MRIALVLRGHYRSFYKTHTSWKEALKNQIYASYFHTWNLVDFTHPTWHRGEKYSLELYPKYIDHLKSFDPNVVIQIQEFTQDDLNDIYCDIPFKSYKYRYESLKDTLKRINPNNYDIILVGRYDIDINRNIFKGLSVKEDEILIGAYNDLNYYKNMSATDIIFAFHPKNIHYFMNEPDDFTRRNFKRGEEWFTDFLYKSFKTVTHKWKYTKDFIIRR
jgi:hypothetical protein